MLYCPKSMVAENVELRRPFSPGVHSINALSVRDLARMTGGTTTGGDLDRYGDDFYIQYPDAIMKFVVEDAEDEGPRPLLYIGSTTIVLESSWVIQDPNRVRIVRASDASGDGSVYLEVVTLESGRASYTLNPFPVEGIKSLDDQTLAEAALLSWNDSRKVLEEQAIRYHGYCVEDGVTDERITDAEKEKLMAQARRQEAETVLQQWRQERFTPPI